MFCAQDCAWIFHSLEAPSYFDAATGANVSVSTLWSISFDFFSVAAADWLLIYDDAEILAPANWASAIDACAIQPRFVLRGLAPADPDVWGTVATAVPQTIELVAPSLVFRLQTRPQSVAPGFSAWVSLSSLDHGDPDAVKLAICGDGSSGSSELL